MSLDQQKKWYRQTLNLHGQVIVDVGANVGALSAFFFKHCGPKGRVVSVEPHPANIKALEKRIKQAGKRWSLKRCAVSDQQGHVALRVMKTKEGDNTMVVEGDGDLKVPCVPLAQLVPNATVVKLDVEGHEFRILPDAVPAMTSVRAWAVELHRVPGHPLEDTLQHFVDHGFSLVTAGHRAGDTSQWVSVEIAPTLTWGDVPGVRTRRNGRPAEFKMLHLVARR